MCAAGQARYGNVDLNTSSLKMYWNVAKQFGGQELWRELLQVNGGDDGDMPNTVETTASITQCY